MAAARIPSAVDQRAGCDVYGFVETMLAADTVHEVEGLLPGYQAYHCVRPRPERGRPHGGITVFVRRLSPLFLGSGLTVTSDCAAGIVWLVVPAFQLTVAVCYFSPAGSAVYSSGVVHPDPLAALFVGLREAEARGHKHLVVGDLNIRIGGLSCDVPSNLAVPPGLSDPSALPTLHHLRYVPSRRSTMDLTVPNKARAVEFLQGLFSVSSVVLNGRAPGDEEGNHTCFSTQSEVPVGASVVDLACASTPLYGLVQAFQVLPFRPSASKDHSALYVSVSGLSRRCYEVPRPGRKRRVYRPTPGSGYVSALLGRQGFFEAMLRAWQAGGVSVEQALQQFTEQLVSCAGGDRDVPAPGPRGSGRLDQPWYDGECRQLSRALDAAWEAWHASRGGVYGTQDGCPQARRALQAARKAYRRCCQAKKSEHAMSVQIDMLQTYFGHTQKDYWKVFFGDRAPQTPLTDVAAWTDYFRSLLGGVLQPQSLGAEDVALKQQLYAAAPKGPSAEMAELSGPVSIAEAQQCMALPTGKAPDAQGLTGELLRLAGALAPAGGPAGEPVSTCPIVVECAQWLLQAMLSAACVPEVMRTSKLVPVPKSLGPAALADRDQYRGISISAVFARFLERLMNQRFERLAARLSLRAPTQCGFRPGYGTLDAIFTLQHLVNAAQHAKRRLYVVFVDFKKAFDKVRRDLLLERCRELGVHGPFLDMLVALYEHVCCQVAVNGELGEVFSTASGTKQGSELSPLLFGLFIELLHYLIKLKLPGAGPVLSGLQVPDVMYADDVTLLSFDPAEVQQLVDVLDVFCRLFDMEVNLAPHKTCVVCFRPQGLPVPRGFRLVYRGREIALQHEYVYLGVRLHETRGLAGASDALAVSGSKAMHALLARCRRNHLTQFDIKCRMFDVLVEPVLSYASHIWGPQLFVKHLSSRPFGTRADQVHTSFLRIMTGAIKGISTDVLYRDMHRLPVMYHWVVLAVRWWTKLSDARDEEPRSLAGCVWREDVRLALSGCKRCWSSCVLTTLCSLGLLDQGWRRQPLDWVLQQRWEESAVQAALAASFRARWQGLTDGDPRSAPSQGIHMRTHHAWVYPLESGFNPFSRDQAAPHTKLCLPFVVLRNLAQLRIGSAHLEIEQGRKSRASVPRSQRLCRLCCGDDAALSHRRAILARTGTNQNVEDLKHFVLECPVYDDLRAACPAFPRLSSAVLSDPDSVAAVFQHAQQSALAKTLYKMKVRRADKLGLTLGI